MFKVRVDSESAKYWNMMWESVEEKEKSTKLTLWN